MNWLLFLSKKIVSAFLFPPGLVLLVLAVGVLAWVWKPHRRIGICLVLLGWVVLLVSSLGISGDLLIHSLESQFSTRADPNKLARQGIKYIVVLGGGVKRGGVDAIDRVDWDSLSRVVEGIRLWKGMPGSKLVLSGGRYSKKDIPSGEAMAAVALKFGVPREAMILETKSWDTDDEARLLKPVLGKKPFVLVTSALHMERSLITFRKMGLHPIPAPTDYKARELRIYFGSFLPRAGAVQMTEAGLHEYVGTAWVYVKNVVRRLFGGGVKSSSVRDVVLSSR